MFEDECQGAGREKEVSFIYMKVQTNKIQGIV